MRPVALGSALVQRERWKGDVGESKVPATKPPVYLHTARDRTGFPWPRDQRAGLDLPGLQGTQSSWNGLSSLIDLTAACGQSLRLHENGTRSRLSRWFWVPPCPYPGYTHTQVHSSGRSWVGFTAQCYDCSSLAEPNSATRFNPSSLFPYPYKKRGL